MKIMQKIMIAVALLGSLALATPAQAYEDWGCHRHHYYSHHYGCYHPYHCHYHHYYEFYHCRPHYHHYHCW